MNPVPNRRKMRVTSALGAAAVVVGLLAVPATAQAAPLAPACSQYGFNAGGLTFTQSNGLTVYLNRTDKVEKTIQGRALAARTSDGTGLAGGDISKAYVTGNLVHISIRWDNGGEGIYSGAVGGDGIVRGHAVDGKGQGPSATWQSIRALPCITAAAQQATATVTGEDVDVYPARNDKNDQPVIGVLRVGDKVTLVGDCKPEDWCNVSGPAVPNGNGWIWGHLQLP